MSGKQVELKPLEISKDFEVERRRFDGIAGMLILSTSGVQISITSALGKKTALQQKTEFEKAIYVLNREGEDKFRELREKFYKDNWAMIESQLKKKGYQVEDQDAFIKKAVDAELKYAQSQETNVDVKSLLPTKVKRVKIGESVSVDVLGKKVSFTLDELRSVLPNFVYANPNQYLEDLQTLLVKKGVLAASKSYAPTVLEPVALELQTAYYQKMATGMSATKGVKYMTEQQIKDFQRMYNSLFASSEADTIAVDGKMGKQTETAIKKMQQALLDGGFYDPAYVKKHGKKGIVDGAMGPQTIKALQNYIEKKKQESSFEEWTFAKYPPDKVIAALEKKLAKPPEENGGQENTKAYVEKLIGRADQELKKEGLSKEYVAKVSALKSELETFLVTLSKPASEGPKQQGE